MTEEITAEGVPEGSTGTSAEPGEIAPVAGVGGGAHSAGPGEAPPPAEPDLESIVERFMAVPDDVRVTLLVEMVHKVSDQRDALQARIDAYEGQVEESEEIDRMIAASSLGDEEAQRVRASVPPQVRKLIARAVEEAERANEAERERDELREALAQAQTPENGYWQARAMGAESVLRDVGEERDRLRRDARFANDAAEAAAKAVGDMAQKLTTVEAERDRLRAVVDAAMTALGDEGPAEAEWLGTHLTAMVAELAECHEAIRLVTQARIRGEVDT